MITIVQDNHIPVARDYIDTIVIDSVNDKIYFYDCNGTWTELCGSCTTPQPTTEKNEYQAFADQSAFPAVGDVDTTYYSSADNAFFIWNGTSYIEVPAPVIKNEYQAFADQSAFPAVGDADTLYYSTADNALYVWNGTSYVEVPTPVIPTTFSLDTKGDVGTGTLVNTDTLGILTGNGLTSTLTGDDFMITLDGVTTATAGQVLTSDGAGNVSWEDIASAAFICADNIDPSACNAISCQNGLFAPKPPVHASAECSMPAPRTLTNTDISAIAVASGNSTSTPSIVNKTTGGFGTTFIPTPTAWVNTTTTSSITLTTGRIVLLDIVYGGEIKPGNLHMSNITSVTNSAGITLGAWETVVMDGFYNYLSPNTIPDNGQSVAKHQIMWAQIISGGSGTLTINFANNTTALANYSVQEVANVDMQYPFIQIATAQGGSGFMDQTMDVALDNPPVSTVYLSGTSSHVEPTITPTYVTDNTLTNLSDRFQGISFACNDHLHTGYGNIQVFQYTARNNDLTGDVRRPVHVALLEFNPQDVAGSAQAISGTSCSVALTNINDCTIPVTAYNGFIEWQLNGRGVEVFVAPGNNWAVEAYVNSVKIGEVSIDNTDSIEMKHITFDGINGNGLVTTALPPGGISSNSVEYRLKVYAYKADLSNAVIVYPYTFGVILNHS